VTEMVKRCKMLSFEWEKKKQRIRVSPKDGFDHVPTPVKQSDKVRRQT
jgi:hypothetical protein